MGEVQAKWLERRKGEKKSKGERGRVKGRKKSTRRERENCPRSKEAKDRSKSVRR